MAIKRPSGPLSPLYRNFQAPRLGQSQPRRSANFNAYVTLFLRCVKENLITYVYPTSYSGYVQRLLAAFFAIAFRSFGESRFALALPPFSPPACPAPGLEGLYIRSDRTTVYRRFTVKQAFSDNLTHNSGGGRGR